MTSDTAEFDIDGITCYPDAVEAATYYCIPGAPTPELDSSGRPTLSLWLIPPQARLQLGTAWALRGPDTDKVRSVLSTRTPSPAKVLAAPVQVDAAVVLLVDQDGTEIEIATSKSSGFPPYSAIFTAMLDDAHAASAASALNGGRGRLVVEYRAHLDRSTPIAVSVTGDVTAELVSTHAVLSLGDARELLDKALSAGHLTLSRSGPQTVPDDVWRPLEDQTRSAAAEDLQTMAAAVQIATARPKSTSINREVSGEHRISTTLTRRADIADWFADGSGAGHIRALGVAPGATR